MSKPLSKSRFKIGAQCPTKLFYSINPEYANANNQNEFLKALAEGGNQVGELAQLYYPGGVKITTLDYEESIRLTDELLQKDRVIIYEAALRFENLFVRVDVLEKDGNQIRLTEVKAKSFNFSEEFAPFDKRSLGKGNYVLKAEYGDYLLDLAFQTYVAKKAKPQFKINPGLMMVDKSKVATVDGLNQLFMIERDESGRVQVRLTKEVSPKDLGAPILTRLDVENEIELIISKAKVDWADNFEALVKNLSNLMASGKRHDPTVGSHCKTCEFRIDKKHLNGAKAGFNECWASAKKLTETELEKEFVFDVWDFRSTDNAISCNKVFASDLDASDLKIKEREDSKIGLSRTQRQLTQIEFAKGERKGIYLHTNDLAAEIATFKAPYHFIDFETAMVAIPFHAGRKPYEQMTYQFSHHVVDGNGNISHKTEYLDDRVGVFPNFDFVRALKKALESDNGTIFRFAAHENTVLNQIRTQLEDSHEKDRSELLQWIESITSPSSSSDIKWTPTRQFIDMRDLTLRHYYLPETRGSNSIKKILPAVLNLAGRDLESRFPGYIALDQNGKVEDPYKKLPSIFADISKSEIDEVERWLIERDDLNDGGAAMMAWSRMQFTEMSTTERKALREALLRYCKLDTLAMVMIWEWWQLEINKTKSRVA